MVIDSKSSRRVAMKNRKDKDVWLYRMIIAIPSPAAIGGLARFLVPTHLDR